MRCLQINKQENEDVYPSDFRGSHLTQRESNYLRKRKLVITQFVVKVKDGWKKGKLVKLRLSHHCHLNGITLFV
jgi:hypothetical protein